MVKYSEEFQIAIEKELQRMHDECLKIEDEEEANNEMISSMVSVLFITQGIIAKGLGLNYAGIATALTYPTILKEYKNEALSQGPEKEIEYVECLEVFRAMLSRIGIEIDIVDSGVEERL